LVILPEVGKFISAILSSPNFIKIGLLTSLVFLVLELASSKKNSENALLKFKLRALFLLEQVRTEEE